VADPSVIPPPPPNSQHRFTPIWKSSDSTITRRRHGLRVRNTNRNDWVKFKHYQNDQQVLRKLCTQQTNYIMWPPQVWTAASNKPHPKELKINPLSVVIPLRFPFSALFPSHLVKNGGYGNLTPSTRKCECTRSGHTSYRAEHQSEPFWRINGRCRKYSSPLI